VEQFELGYSPEGPASLVGHLKEQGVQESVMVSAGLGMKSRQGRLIDRFRGRVMFPIYDVRGDAVGFGARLLGGDGPKYLNSSESMIYQKSRLLYGLNWAKSEIVRSGEAVIVEGYTDVIAMHAAERPIAVATCGTAFGEKHLELMRRFTERVVLAFDADEAGSKAALRGFELDNPVNLDLRMALMPGGGDPADLVQEGRIDEVQLAIDKSVPLIQYRLERELEAHNLDEPEARGRAIRAAAEIIARHPDRVVRHEYAVVVSRKTGVDLSVVTQAVDSQDRAAPAPSAPAVQASDDVITTGRDKAEAAFLRLLMANRPVARETDAQALFANPHLAAAYEAIRPRVDLLAPNATPDTSALLEGIEDDQAGLLRRLAMERLPLPDAEDLVLRLRLFDLDDRVVAARSSLDRLDPDTQPEVYSQQFTALLALEREKQELRSQD
jgi:DNA primase